LQGVVAVVLVEVAVEVLVVIGHLLAHQVAVGLLNLP
jgi:hypothetical protein